MEQKKSKRRDFLETLGIFLLVFTIKFCVVDVMEVQGVSMEPTFKENGDRVILNRINHYTNDYERGDIVVAKRDGDTDYVIKRIIGLPNDIIEIKNGNVFVNGEMLQEEYLEEGILTPSNLYPFGEKGDLRVKVPEGQVFLLGDNRLNSEDSRSYGCVDFNEIKGKAIVKFTLMELTGEILN